MKKTLKLTIICLFVFTLIFAWPNDAIAQGNITGIVQNADLSTPDNGEIYFVGYIDGTDEEIHIESSVGAGYDAGNWYDNFANYLTENPDDPFDFHFFNLTNGETASLDGTIDSGSYHPGYDILLGTDPHPAKPDSFFATLLWNGTMRLFWDFKPETTYRLYRRFSYSDGSFFRIDDPTGSLSNPGVDSVFYDSTLDSSSEYEYLLIPFQDDMVGPHSDILTVHSDPDVFLCGDANGDGKLNVFDVTYFIVYLYKGGPAPPDLETVDLNGLPGINVFDITYLIVYLYKGGPVIDCN